MKASEYFQFSEVFGYFFRKKDPNRASNFNIRAMHGINKISMLIFLIGLAVLVFRLIKRSM